MIRASRILVFALLIGFAAGARGADAGAAATARASTSPLDTETHKIEGIFNTDLPKTERKGSIRLIVHPHFGDFTNRSYLRVPAGIRWGVSQRAEITATVESYFSHGLKHGSAGAGIGDVELGGKYNFKSSPGAELDTSVGFNALFPVGHPPVDLTTGYNRYSPYVVVGRKITSHPGLSVFLNTGVNLLSKSSVAGSFERNQAHSNSIALTPGFVYDHYPYHYTFELGYETTSLIGHGSQQFLTLRPGFAWDLPPRFKFLSAGHWVIGFGFHVTFGPDGTSTGGGGKVRAEFGLKRWFQKR